MLIFCYKIRGPTHEAHQDADAELQAVDFSTQPGLSGNEAALSTFVNQHHMPGELVSDMSITVPSNVWTDQELITTMVNSTGSAISQLYDQLEINFGCKLASPMLLRMCDYNIECNW